ncbi:MAG: hypothetical protein AB8H80_06825 [Planctomycetota bacterium]
MHALATAISAALAVAAALAAQGKPAAKAKADPWRDHFTMDRIEIPAGIDPQIGGMDATPSGKLAMCFHRGEVFLFDPATSTWAQFAEGLHEPLGLLAESDSSLLVMQRAELTRLRDTDGDGRADEYETVYDGFGMTGNYHEFAFGPARDADGNLYIALNTASNGAGIREEIRGEWNEIGLDRSKMAVRGKPWRKQAGAAGRMYARAAWRGWVLKMAPDGSKAQPFACGFRSPDGIGFDAAGRLLVTDNQGDWLGTSKVHHVRKDRFHGHPASLIWRDGWTRNPLEMKPAELDALRTEAMGLLPQGELASSPTQPITVPDGVFGACAGQTLIGEMNQKTLIRFVPDCADGVSQGAAIPFLQSDALGNGNHRLAFTEDGSLWVAKTHLSWAGAEGLMRVRQRAPSKPLFMVQRVRLTKNGFELDLTEPPSADTLALIQLKAHTYRYHKAYGSPKIGESKVAITKRERTNNGRTLVLDVAEQKERHVYTIGLEGLRSDDGSRRLLGDRVYYTLVAARR